MSANTGVWLEDLTWPEAKVRFEAGALVVVPVGAASKAHGPHLPLKTDALTARTLAQKLIERLPVIAAPVVGFFLRGTPEEVGLLPDGAKEIRNPALPTKPMSGLTVAEALRTRTFWQLCLIFFAVSACANGTITHLAPLLTDQGVPGRN